MSRMSRFDLRRIDLLPELWLLSHSGVTTHAPATNLVEVGDCADHFVVCNDVSVLVSKPRHLAAVEMVGENGDDLQADFASIVGGVRPDGMRVYVSTQPSPLSFARMASKRFASSASKPRETGR